jgi:TfoX-like protein
MPFNQALAVRVREVLQGTRSLKEKQMFGGLAFLVRGHMCCGIVGDDLVVRTGPEAYDAALSKPHARAMDFTGRPMRGLLYVSPAGCRSSKALKSWIQMGTKFVSSLPPK